ncbi:MAG TPA: hypothetical protein VK652_15585 [Steroidobacteraceae bacterium]|nr:hypothetical protein [Steroidobacteraceae bacterium]
MSPAFANCPTSQHEGHDNIVANGQQHTDWVSHAQAEGASKTADHARVRLKPVAPAVSSAAPVYSSATQSRGHCVEI